MDRHTVTCEFGDFIESYLPDTGSNLLDAVVAKLKKQKVLSPIPKLQPHTTSRSTHRQPYTHYVLKPFKAIFQTDSPQINRVTKSLQTVVHAVRKALQRRKGVKVNGLVAREHESIHGVIASLSANCDGPLQPTDVAIPLAVLDQKADVEAEGSTFVSRVIRIMNEDARRKFAYGVMIHGTELSLWCISRSHAVKSIPISILEHSDLLIRALVSLTSAAEDQLGFDPLINLLPDGSYVYTLPPDDLRTTPLFYHTLVLVSQFHSSSPGGRTSRIWKVRQVASPTDPSPIPGTANMILKDATLDARLPTEADNQRQLFADIADIAKNEKWRSHPIVKEFHARDLALLFDAFQGENFKRYFACITASHVAKPCTVAGGDLSPDSPNPARRRCFFICDSICTPLYDIPTLGDAMDVLIQSLTALQLMFCAGWVHRDVSAGNILAVQSSPADPWRVKLSDLEYARRFPVEGAVEDAQKTGTPYFMACELLSLSNFLPDIRRRGGHRPIYPKKPVIHNYQHDLEAIWWIALWLICMRINQPLPRSFGNEHFQHNVGRTYSDIRSCLFADPFSLGSYSSLTQSLPPPLRSTFLSSLDALRNNLYVEYVSRNKEGKQDDPGTYSWIASEGFTLFIESIRGCRDEWAKIPLMVESKLRLQRQRQVRPPPPPPPPPAKKRKSEDDGQSQSMGETQLEDQRRPKKKVRATPQAPPQRSGPVTRSMTRRQTTTGPLTRAASRRLQELKGKGASSRPIVGSAVRKTCR